MRFRYLEYLGWPSDIAWHGFRKGISDCATQSLSDMPFRLIWEIIQNPFCLRSVMQWPQHQSFGTLSTFLQVLDSSGFCCHCVLNRTSFRILKNWKLSGSRARRGPMSGELSAAMSRGAQRKLDKGLIFHPTAGEHVRKTICRLLWLWLVNMQRRIRNTTPPTLPAMSSNGRKALTLIWYPIRFKSTGSQGPKSMTFEAWN